MIPQLIFVILAVAFYFEPALFVDSYYQPDAAVVAFVWLCSFIGWELLVAVIKSLFFSTDGKAGSATSRINHLVFFPHWKTICQRGQSMTNEITVLRCHLLAQRVNSSGDVSPVRFDNDEYKIVEADDADGPEMVESWVTYPVLSHEKWWRFLCEESTKKSLPTIRIPVGYKIQYVSELPSELEDAE